MKHDPHSPIIQRTTHQGIEYSVHEDGGIDIKGPVGGQIHVAMRGPSMTERLGGAIHRAFHPSMHKGHAGRAEAEKDAGSERVR